MISTRFAGLASAASTVARAGAAPGDPGVPHLVHFVEAADVAQPDTGEQDLRLVAAGLAEQAVDLRQDLPGLRSDRRNGVVGDLAGEVDNAGVDHGLAHARADVKAPDHASPPAPDSATRRLKSLAPATMKLLACS